MGFYEEIAKYYDYIFPVSHETVDFIMTTSGKPPKYILDVACGTGGYSLEQEKYGYIVTAIDIDKAMIEELKKKAGNLGSKVEYLQAGMLELKEKLQNKSFDVIFCIGNSLVHLDNNKEIDKFLHDAKSILAHNGKLIIQTINYDRIISKNIMSLPVIINESVGLRFERYYKYESNVNKVLFKTILSVGDKIAQNEIPLTPVKHDEILQMLRSAGFTKINVYGGYNKSVYDKENSYLMVIVAE